MEQETILRMYFIIIVTVVLGVLLLNIKSHIGQPAFEKDILARDFGMLQSSAMVVNDSLEIETNLHSYSGKYGFKEKPACEIQFFDEIPDKSNKVYFCFDDLTKERDILTAEFYDVEKITLEIKDNILAFTGFPKP